MADKTIKFLLVGEDRSASAALKGLGDEADKASRQIGGIGDVAAGVLTADMIKGAADAVIDFGKQSVESYADAEKSQRALADAYDRFPAVASVSIDKMRELNQAIQDKTGADADDLAAGQATLAQYGLTGEQLAALTPLLDDYAVKTGKDVTSAAEDLGKAMLGQGRALKDVGIDFEDTGSVAGNFDQVMDGLRTQVGGFAEGEASSAEGTLKRLQTNFGDVQEQVGSYLMPVLISLGNALLDTVKFIQENTDWLLPLGTAIAVAAAGYLALAAAQAVMAAGGIIAWIKNLTVVQGILNVVMAANPIALVVIAIAALVAALIVAYNNSEDFRRIVDAAFQGVKTVAETVATWFTDTLVPWFQSVGEGIKAVFTTMSDWVSNRLADIRNAGQAVGDFFTVTLPAAFEQAKTSILDKVNLLKDGAIAAFDGLRSGVETVMDGVRAAAAAPINFVITTVYNNGLRKMVQGLIDLFGLGWELPTVEPIQLARGAIMGDGRRPIIWNEAGPEAYIPLNGSQRSMDLWVETGRQLGAIPMADGGVWPVNGTISSGYGNRVGPFYGAEFHDGIDIAAAAGTPVMSALDGTVVFAGWNGGYGNYVKVDHGGGLATFYGHLAAINTILGALVQAGQVIGLVGSTGASTGPHLHFGASMDGSSIDPNSVLSGAVAGSPSVFSFISQIDEFIGSLAGIGDTQWAQLAGDVVKGTLGRFGDWVRDKVGGLFSGSSDPVAVGSVQSMAQEMAAARGWTGAQWDALNWIVEHESSWNSNAQNPSSTAYGLFQFLDSTWSTVGASKTSDPAAQIDAGLAYIAQRYGSPSAAQAFWQANGWYDQGGVLPPGLTLAVNATGKNEAVLTNEEWATLRAAANAPATASPKEMADAIVAALVAAKLKTRVVGVVDAVGDVLVTEILAGYEGSV